eukprot:6201915-Pleurochrysis_carterae.AAC.6
MVMPIVPPTCSIWLRGFVISALSRPPVSLTPRIPTRPLALLCAGATNLSWRRSIWCVCAAVPSAGARRQCTCSSRST